MSTAKPAIEKAIYDKAVIDAWQTRRAGYFRSFNWMLWITSLLGVPLVGLLAFLDVAWWPIAAGLLVLATWISMQWTRDRHLRCPHCGKRVRSASASPLLPQPAYCRHCLHWLESPYASDEPAA